MSRNVVIYSLALIVFRDNSSSNQDLKEDFNVFIPASASAAQAVNDNTHKRAASPAAALDTHQSDAHISEESKACSENISAETEEGTTEKSISTSTATVEKTSDALSSETSTASSSVEQSQHAAYRRAASTVSRKTSSDSLYSSCVSFQGFIFSGFHFLNL